MTQAQAVPTPMYHLDPSDYFSQPEQAHLRRMYLVLGKSCLEPQSKNKIIDQLPNRKNYSVYAQVFEDCVAAGFLVAHPRNSITVYTLTPAGEEWLNRWFTKFGKRRG